jgi:asparagine synthase (glutamine-hydrolysing)
MCGIIGAFGARVDSHWVEKNLSTLIRRGPDSRKAIKVDEFCAMGATRLAMVDPLPRSDQPFLRNQDLFVFNGEIYNYKRLKEQLIGKFAFETDSDTEALLALIRVKGSEGLGLVDGMFAFALYNKEARTITLARDNLGKKPLYYVLSKGNLYFSSLQEPLKDFRGGIEARALYEYLSFGYLIDPDTIDSQIKAVSPGEIIKFSLDGEKVVRITEKEKLVTRPGVQQRRSEMELRSRVIESVKARIEGHKNVAISLSGGIDSSVIAIALSELGVRGTAFSVRWPDSDKKRYNDDSTRAQSIAKQLKHDFIFVDSFDTSKLEERIDVYLQIMEEPSSNSTGLSMIDLYAKMSEMGFRLALTGDGADEFFGGYERYHRLVSISKLPFASFNFSLIKKTLSLKSGEEQELSNFNFWARWHRIFQHSEALALVGNFVAKESLFKKHLFQKFKPYEDLNRYSQLKQIQSLDQRLWLTMESNRRLDRISMHHSVEARSPFQDLLSQGEFAGANERALLKSVGKVNLMAAFPELSKLPINPDKVGFISPLGHWLRSNLKFVQGRLNYLEDILGLPAQKIDLMVARLHSGDFDNLRKTWSLVVLSRYLEEYYVDGK